MIDPLETPIPALPDDRIAALARDRYGLEGTLRHLGGERDRNVLVETTTGCFVLKIANRAEGRGIIGMQVAALEHLARVDPELPVPRVVRSVDGHGVETVEIDGVEHAVRVVTYLEGAPAAPPLTAPLATATGAMLGRVQRGLAGFFHPEAGRALLWDARAAGRLLPWTEQIADPALRVLARETLAQFAARVPDLARLPAQVIHNDFHAGNLLVAADGQTVTGVIDFGDLVHAPRVQDLGVAVAYGVLATGDPLATACRIVDGFLAEVPLFPAELAILDDVILTRLAQSVAIGAHRATSHPENVAYIAADGDGVGAMLVRWATLDRTTVRATFIGLSGAPPPPAVTPSLVARRGRVLAPSLQTSYDTPLHVMRGEGAWLFAADGTRYLDAYNNVPHVGHGHPRVARAIAAQTAALTTNTRYLTDGIVAYAERLAALLPGELRVCYFVNSGSEANDLAWRIAKAVSGNDGAIVTDFAYHGWTDALIQLSPEEHAGRPLAAWVASVPPPAPGADLHGAVVAAVARLADGGHEPAAAMIDSAFSSDGIFDLPPGYHAALADAVHAAGGVVIADEVQAGLGRIGDRYWGFAVDGFVPDVVTLGKPIGNGFPMGAVITTPAIAERFAELGYFFSTFGGSPVASAAGLAVLDVTRDEELPARAEAVGATLRRDLAAALRDRGVRATVRGAGLFIGVELGDAGLAHEVVEGLKARRVLVSVTGPRRDVLKIRPPLAFDMTHAALLLEALDATLAAR